MRERARKDKFEMRLTLLLKESGGSFKVTIASKYPTKQLLTEDWHKAVRMSGMVRSIARIQVLDLTTGKTLHSQPGGSLASK